MTILDEIFAHKRREVTERRQGRPLAAVQQAAQAAAPARDFILALQDARLANASPALIAEIKRASPSRGALAPDLEPVSLARLYQENGAAAISVLTDNRYFQGSLMDLEAVVQSGCPLPVLRKDFICDAYQVYEARAAGADAVLLIVAGLQPAELAALHALIGDLGMAALVEVHCWEELELALSVAPCLVGINHRDLRDFSVRLETSQALIPLIPEGVCVVAESGIHTPSDVRLLAEGGVDAILVGEALVTAPDIPARVRSLAWCG
jgi:indole-3-glycerol phosphate synthase